MEEGRSSFSLTLLFIFFHPLPCLSLVFLFFFSTRGSFSSCWHSCKPIRLDSHSKDPHLYVGVCVFLQAIEAGGRRIPLRSQPKGIQSAIPDHSGEIFYLSEITAAWRLFSASVKWFPIIVRLKKKIPLALCVKEIFFADSQVVFRHRLLYFHQVSWPGECKENNQELKRKWTNESVPSFTNHKTCPSRQNSHLSHFSSGFCSLLGHVTYSKPVSQAHPSARNGITNFWTFSGRINAPGSVCAKLAVHFHSLCWQVGGLRCRVGK